jgi:putative CocE/NonD family hydrolase
LFLWREIGPVRWYVERHGYAYVHMDLRGSGKSEGDYRMLSKLEQDDLYEVIEWIARQPWSNGNVGGIGQSYYCWTQWFMGIVNPPHLKCLAPYDGSIDIYRDATYHGGIYGDFIGLFHQIVRVNNLHRPAALPGGKLLDQDVGLDIARRQTYDDWWRERSAFERIGEIEVPTYSIGHWGKMGLHLRGNILAYEAMKCPKWLDVTGAPGVFGAHDL